MLIENSQNRFMSQPHRYHQLNLSSPLFALDLNNTFLILENRQKAHHAIYLSHCHCLPGSPLPGSWGQKLKTGIRPRSFKMGHSCLTSVSNTRLNARTFRYSKFTYHFSNSLAFTGIFSYNLCILFTIMNQAVI